MYSKTFLLYLIVQLSLAYSFSEQKVWRWDYSYVKSANGYFKYHDMPATWDSARQQCYSEGAVLASVYPDKVYDALLSQMEYRKTSDVIFVGVHAAFNKGDFMTLDGIPLKKTDMKWVKQESEGEDKNCLIFTSEGLVDNKNCEDMYTYYCYKKETDNNDMIFLSSCGTNTIEYEHSNVTDSWYKFYPEQRTWQNAQKTCSAEGAHLVIINSDEEAEVIKHLFAKYPESAIKGEYRKDTAFVGFHDWGHWGNWRTIDGETLEKAGYSKFDEGEPNNWRNDQHCGSVSREVLFWDMSCDYELLAFICEKEPKNLVCAADQIV